METSPIEIILEEVFRNHNTDLPTAAYDINLWPKKMIKTFKKNQFILNQFEEAKYLYVLLDGKVSIEDETIDDENNIIEYVRPVHILGLVEALNNKAEYSASVVSRESCTTIKIEISYFLNLLKNNGSLCYQVLLSLGSSTLVHMYDAKSKIVLPQENFLGHYLFKLAKKKSLPYVYPHTREQLADEINVNLRTLYRYLSSLKKENIITLVDRKITVSEESFKLMKDKYQNLSFK